jgi:DTW domain-containing protein YfiP
LAIEVTPRAVCDRCRRPRTVCYCAKLTELPTQTRVVILQHPRERDKAIGTARMATLCLPESELLVGVRWDSHPGLLRAIADPMRPAALLFPGPGAKDILTERPSGPITLIVVDGTWSQAKNLVRDNPILSSLPRYAFAAPSPSEYRIRKEPGIELVSTIEALMYVLGVLEGQPSRFRALLEPFRAMVDAQLLCQAQRPERRYRQPRGERPVRPRLPPALAARYDDLVCVVGDANAWPYHSGRASIPDELVHWVAIRPSTGERFEQLAAPQEELSPNTMFHTQLSEEQLRTAGTRASLLAAFAGFVRPTDVIASWGHYATNLFVEAGGELTDRLDLRALGHRLLNKKMGSLEDAAAAVGPPLAPLGHGRAGRRLAAVTQLVAHWRATFAA